MIDLSWASNETLEIIQVEVARDADMLFCSAMGVDLPLVELELHQDYITAAELELSRRNGGS